jgi:SAM-dependent methyltransferase/uncharacterized protein YbaR (Trm112 family)
MEHVLDPLRCPACKERLNAVEGSKPRVECAGCRRQYPVWTGIPVLINADASLFDPPEPGDVPATPSRGIALAKKWLPAMGHNLNARSGYRKFVDLLKASAAKPRVLVIGAGDGGVGADELSRDGTVEVINMDVVPRKALTAIGDAHDLPMGDASCDGVVIQAVLEHVLDPHRVVAEIFRVLKNDGLIYAETPFMQMVHERAYDYTRFTDLGHRYLFRQFTEIERGITGGPGMTLLWAWCYFLRALFPSRTAGGVGMALGRLTGFWLLWVDRLLQKRPGAYDACSGLFFLGRKSTTVVAQRELVRLFRGL